ncbi:MAG: phosphoribosylamine--glycine ligase [Planctomycetes bacterium]|nr:phosphoribosylamine--glycine ligase [Planctomycetota bacterium]
MRVLVIGSGGREHALVRGLAASPRLERVYCAPGNAGTAQLAENVAIGVDEHARLLEFACAQNIALTVVGPEAPLCAGIVDRFRAAGLRIFGPTAAAARIEGDKTYAKRLMKVAHVPTAEGRCFERYGDAREYIATRETGLVVKAAGLAAGKGVFVCPDPADALIALEQIMLQRVFGVAGDQVVVEDLLKGEELSVLALVDGNTIYVLETAQDHKRIGDGDCGANTGGMGAYSPAPLATPELMARVEREILVPIVDALRIDGAPYGGVLYAGLMVTPAGPKVLEFNCRFGDPETQAILFRLESDLFELLSAVVDGRLADAVVRWRAQPAVCVVMASRGYPDAHESGKVIEGLDRAAAMEDVFVFHAGTRQLEHLTVTAGGRVLGVTAAGDDLAAAQRRAYAAVEAIHFDNACFRRDIAARALGRAAPARAVATTARGAQP